MPLGDAQRQRLERAMRTAARGVEREYLARLIDLLGNPPALANVPASFWNAFRAAYLTGLKPTLEEIYLAAVRASVKGGAGEVLGVDWTLANTQASAWATSYGFDLVRGMTTTLRSDLSAAVQDFFTVQGTTVGDLRTQLEAVTPPLVDRLGRVWGSAERAEMIATTEVTRAADQGEQNIVNEIRAKDPNIDFREFWETHKDEIVHKCPICWPLQGVQGDGNGNFVHPDTGKVYRIPGHPRCRCRRRRVMYTIKSREAIAL